MEDLFASIGMEVGRSRDRIVAAHNAVVDDVFSLPLTRAEFRAKFDLGEQRFQGPESQRIGGGAINFALTSASLGHPGASFAGFMDRCAKCAVERLKRAEGISLPLDFELTGPRRNTVIELMDDNLLLHDSSASAVDPRPLALRIGAMGLSAGDWIASCSFYPQVTVPLMGLSGSFFLDSGYGYPRRARGMMTALLEAARGMAFSDFIVAANQTELDNLCDEFGLSGGAMEKGRALSGELSRRGRTAVSVLLHTARFSSFFEPDSADAWAVPTFDVHVKRRTNAGDTFAGAFLSAYDAIGEARLSVFYANAAAAKRLSDDELPNPANMAEFLRRARMRELAVSGGATLGLDSLRSLMPGRASSVCAIASRAEEAPAPRISRQGA